MWIEYEIIDWNGPQINGRHYGLINTDNIDSIHTSCKDDMYIVYVHSVAGCLEFKYPTFDMCIQVKDAFRSGVLGSVGTVFDIGYVRPLTVSKPLEDNTIPKD